jgi:hypothetical protein
VSLAAVWTWLMLFCGLFWVGVLLIVIYLT